MPIEIDKYQAGHYEKEHGYQYFVPSAINDQWQWDNSELNSLLERASIKLGELNAYARLVPNVDHFIQLHVTKEAVVSSRIEGTRTQIDEALLPVNEVNPERKEDWIEVKNYTQALNEAIENLEELPLSSRMIRNAHRTLIQGARGAQKLPGEFRRSQNWIGGNSLKDAVFIPPAHHYIPELMSDLENFLHNRDIQVPDLIRIGIAHYQFESIHPFLDGNGRIGRLLITLFLVSENILEEPLLYLSSYFERNKGLYYDNLTFTREKNDILQWLKYFLVGVYQTANEAVSTLEKILELKNQLEETIRADWGKRILSALTLLDSLFENPVIQTQDAVKITKLSFKAANDLVGSFESAEILKEVTGQSRHRIFIFKSYVDLFK